MADLYRVKITLRASIQLQNIFNYIERDSPANASKMVHRLLESIDSLDFMPRRYPLVLNSQAVGVDVYSMAVRPYLVRYHIDDSESIVTVLSIRHGARQFGL